MTFFKTEKFAIGFLALAVLLVYGWTLSFGFLYYDDNVNIFENQKLLQGNFWYFWTSSYEGLYIPVVYSIWFSLYKLFGLNASVFHLCNLLFHFFNGILVYRIASGFKFSRTAALAGAILFIVHPLQVESVAWVSSLKDTSFAFFSLMSTWFFLFSESSDNNRRWSGFFSATLAVLSKPTAAVLPVFIIVYLILTEKGNLHESLKHAFKKYSHLSVVVFLSFCSVFVAKGQQAAFANHPHVITSLFEKPIVMLDAIGFYLYKFFIPQSFYVDYGRYPRNVLDNNLYIFNICVALIFIFLILYLILFKRGTIKNWFYFSVCWAILFFLPTSGLISFGHQVFSTTADRYMYVVLVGFAVAFSAMINKFQEQYAKQRFNIVICIVLSGLAAISAMQTINWKNLELFTENLYEGNPNNYFANRNIGLFYQLKGRDDVALDYFQKAFRIDPSRLSAMAGIVSVYFNRKDYEKMDAFIEENLTEAKINGLQKHQSEIYSFYRAVAESHMDRNNKKSAFIFYCRAYRASPAESQAEIGSILQKLTEDLADHSSCPK